MKTWLSWRQSVAIVLGSLGIAAVVMAWQPWRHEPDLAIPHPTTPAAALEELRQGNERYIDSHRTLSTDTRHDAELRHHTAQQQHPFVAILGCSDSRVCPEFIFDQRPGSIFEIRNAGNVVDEDVLASLEYAVEHLHVPLIVVLGHKGCGAIEAVCEAGDRPLHDHLRALQEHMRGIHPAVVAGNHQHDRATVNRLALENARQQALTIRNESGVVAEALRHGHVQLFYALYDMETGRVEFYPLPQP